MLSICKLSVVMLSVAPPFFSIKDIEANCCSKLDSFTYKNNKLLLYIQPHMVFRLAVNLTAKLQLLDHRCLVSVPRAVPYNETDPNLLRQIFELRHPCPEQVCDPMEGISGPPRFHNNNLCLGSLGEMS